MLNFFITTLIVFVIGGECSISPSLSPSASPTSTRSSLNTINLVAGTGTAASTGTGGKATAASFNVPRGMWQDSLGVMFVGELNSRCIRKFSVTDSIVVNYAGQCGTEGFTGDGGAATSGLLYAPMSIVVDSVGVLYSADFSSNRVRSVSASGILSTFAGRAGTGTSGDGGQATSASMNAPIGVWVNTVGLVYITDYGNYNVRSVSTSGIINTFAGIGGFNGFSGNGGAATSALMAQSEKVFGDTVGVVYIADSSNYVVRAVSAAGIISTFAGTGSSSFNSNGLAATSTGLTYPTGMTIDPKNGDFYVNGRSGSRVWLRTGSTGLMSTVTGTGTQSSTGDGGAATSANVILPECLFYDTNSKLYILDYEASKLRVVYSTSPTVVPTLVPSISPTFFPSLLPSVDPSLMPTVTPTILPTVLPSQAPTLFPSVAPSLHPTYPLTSSPSSLPTSVPTTAPSLHQSPTFKVRNAYAFAGLTSDGSVLCWGAAGSGGDCSGVQSALIGVSEIVAGKDAFVALLSKSGFVAWGDAGSILGWYSFSSTAMQSMVASGRAFAGVTTAGAVIAFGAASSGGNMNEYGWSQYLSNGVLSVHASQGAFAALKSDGSVYSWGNKFAGGGEVSSLSRSDLSDVVHLSATRSSFAGVTSEGAVVAWGNSMTGGVVPSSISTALSGSARMIIGGNGVFVAFTSSAGAVVWGSSNYGGDSSSVNNALNADLKVVEHTATAFAAVLKNGSVIVWGNAYEGGDMSNADTKLVNVSAVKSTVGAFAALTGDGDVISWGNSNFGASETVYKSVREVYHTSRAFAALHANGSVSVWGSESFGGSAGSMLSYLNHDVKMVCANDVAFTAILSNGSAVAWGHRLSVAEMNTFLTGDFSNVTSC